MVAFFNDVYFLIIFRNSLEFEMIVKIDFLILCFSHLVFTFHLAVIHTTRVKFVLSLLKGKSQNTKLVRLDKC